MPHLFFKMERVARGNSGTHHSEHLGIENTTKAIVARAIVRNSPLNYFPPTVWVSLTRYKCSVGYTSSTVANSFTVQLY